MSAETVTLAYWGQLPRQWGTSTTTTDIARRNSEAEELPESPQEIVFIVAPHKAAFSTQPRQLRYRVPALSKLLPRMFMLEAPQGFSVASSAAPSVSTPEVDPNAWRGIFTIRPARNVLFSQTLELRTGTLRRLMPRIHIDRRTSERENA